MRTATTVGTFALLVATAVGAPVAEADQARAGGTFSPAGSLDEWRIGHTATLLAGGQRVLIIGGDADGTRRASAELWDPATATFAPTGSLAEARWNHTATLLPTGGVLVIGGDGGDGILASAELWDPVSGAFRPAGSLAHARTSHSATLLDDGRVLVVGGSADGADGSEVTLESAEVWDPATASFSAAGSLSDARESHTATLLPDGSVVIIGGDTFTFDDTIALASVERWDPVTASFVAGGSLAGPRMDHTATLLPQGGILIVGGYLEEPLASAERWDPETGSSSPTGSLAEARVAHTATLLPDGSVLVIGGEHGAEIAAKAERWDAVSSGFGDAGTLGEARTSHTATLLPDGGVLVVGGGAFRTDGFFILATAERWDPAVQAPVSSSAPNELDAALAAVELMNKVPGGIKETCVPGTALVDGQRAAAQCSYGTDTVVYASFQDGQRLAAAYLGIATAAAVEGGTSCEAGPFEGPYLAADGTEAGRVVCQDSPDGPVLAWSDHEHLVLGVVLVGDVDFPTLVDHWMAVRLDAAPADGASPTPTAAALRPVGSGSELRQWAESAVASSQYTRGDWSAGQATGSPDTPEYGDHMTAWAPANSEGGEEWLELTYARSVLPTLVSVHESSGSGALVRVEAYDDATATWSTLWEGSDPSPDALATFSPPLATSTSTSATRRLRLTIDTGVPGWNEIDAVELVGTIAP